MPFTVVIPDNDPEGLRFTVDRRLWLTSDRQRVVEDGDPDGRFLLAGGPGATIPRRLAEALGLLGQSAPSAPPAEALPRTPEPEAEPEPAKQAEKPADKQAPQPKNKSRTTAARKRG